MLGEIDKGEFIRWRGLTIIHFYWIPYVVNDFSILVFSDNSVANSQGKEIVIDSRSSLVHSFNKIFIIEVNIGDWLKTFRISVTGVQALLLLMKSF